MTVNTRSLGAEIVMSPGQGLIDQDPAEIRALVREHAWVYFSGFDASIEDFQALAERFGQTAPPRRMPETPGETALGFHAEDSYNAWRPDVVWFLCLSSGTDGGTPTDVLDGVALLDSLGKKWKGFALANDLLYTQTWQSAEWRQALDAGSEADVTKFLEGIPGLAYQFLADGSLQTAYLVPMAVATQTGLRSFSNTMLHAVTAPEFYGMSLADGSPLPAEFLDLVQERALSSRIPIGWNQGDVAVIDNYRLMHRRGVYLGEGRDVRVIHGAILRHADAGYVLTVGSAP